MPEYNETSNANDEHEATHSKLILKFLRKHAKITLTYNVNPVED